MRRRTFFGLFCDAVNPIWFSCSLFILRVIVGAGVFMFGLGRLSEWTVVSDLGSDAWFKSWFIEGFAGGFLESIFPWLMVVLGILLIFGIMTRPVSLALLVLHILVYAWEFDSEVLISLPLIYIVIFTLFLSGGLGHVIGVDYFLYFYAREKTWITRILLG